MSPKKLSTLLGRIGNSHNAGLDPGVLWHSEADRQKGALQQTLQNVHRELERGESLAEALASTRQFPPLVVNLAGVGEKSGRIGDMFLTLADHYHQQAELRRTMILGSIWPALQLTAALMIIGIIIVVMGMVNSMNTDMNGPGAGAIDPLGMGLFGTRGLLIYMSGLGALVLLTLLSIMILRLPAMTNFRLAICRRIPVIGGYLRDAAVSRWAKAFSLAIDAGMDAVTATELAIQAAEWPPFVKSEERFLTEIRRSEAFAVAANRAETYPQEVIDALDHGQETGNLSESLARTADEFSTRAAAKLKFAGVVLSFVSWGLVALLIVTVIFKLALFYINLINSLL